MIAYQHYYYDIFNPTTNFQLKKLNSKFSDPQIHNNYHHNYHHQQSHQDLPHFTELPWVSHQFEDDRQPPRVHLNSITMSTNPNLVLQFCMMIDKLGMEWNVILILTLQDCNVMIDGESEHYHHRGEYGSNSERSSSSDFRAVSNQLRGFKSNSMNYENRCCLNYYYYHGKVSDNNNNKKRVLRINHVIH